MTFLSLPLHPRLVHFPIALLLLGAAASLIYQWRRYPWLKNWGFVSMLLGWVLTLPAIITGLIEKSAIAPNTAADRLANLHTTGMFIMWSLFGFALYLQYIWRGQLDEPGKRWRWTILLLMAIVLLVVAGDLGGRMVYELGVGVQTPVPTP